MPLSCSFLFCSIPPLTLDVVIELFCHFLFSSVPFLPLTLHVVIELFEENVLQEILVGKRQELWFSELPGDVGSRRRRIGKDFAGDVIERPGAERERDRE